MSASQSTRRLSSCLRLAVIALAIGVHAQADTVTLLSSHSNGQTWTLASSWSDNLAAHSGSDYFVGSNRVLRTPTSGSNTFPGDSLTLSSGQFNLVSGNGTTTTVNNLTLSGGVIVNAISGPNEQTLSGTLHFDPGTSFVRSTDTATNRRDITLKSAISGSADATAHFLRLGTFTLDNAANTFNGTWMVGGSGVALGVPISNNFENISTLKATPAGSLGSDASVVLDLWSRFDVDYDWATTGSLTLASNGGASTAVVMTLDQNITVGELTIAGTSLPADTYDFTELSSAFAGYFAAGGTGSITVVPEPASAALLGAVALGGVAFSRRRRSV